MKHAISLVVLLQVPAALAAQEIREACLPPVPPDTALPEGILQLYRRELVIEFEVYFRALTVYIACLDAERTAVFKEARDVTERYEDFLDVVTKDENE